MRGTTIALLSAAVAIMGCGRGDGDSTFNPQERLECIREQGLLARSVGPTTIQVGAGDAGPRVVVYRTAGEAETESFVDNAPGAEQIGTALLYTNEGSDEALKKVETCLE